MFELESREVYVSVGVPWSCSGKESCLYAELTDVKLGSDRGCQCSVLFFRDCALFHSVLSSLLENVFLRMKSYLNIFPFFIFQKQRTVGAGVVAQW